METQTAATRAEEDKQWQQQRADLRRLDRAVQAHPHRRPRFLAAQRPRQPGPAPHRPQEPGERMVRRPAHFAASFR